MFRSQELHLRVSKIGISAMELSGLNRTADSTFIQFKNLGFWAEAGSSGPLRTWNMRGTNRPWEQRPSLSVPLLGTGQQVEFSLQLGPEVAEVLLVKSVRQTQVEGKEERKEEAVSA